MTERKYNWLIGGLVTVAVLGIVCLIFFDPIMSFLSPKEETPVEPVVEVVAPVEDVKEPEPNPDINIEFFLGSKATQKLTVATVAL